MFIFLLLSALCTLWGRKLKEKNENAAFKFSMYHLVPFKIESIVLQTQWGGDGGQLRERCHFGVKLLSSLHF